jgi:hypothetical protein
MQDVKFKRLKIEGWRQFHAVDIELHPRLTILTGANGAGKSTLLGLFTRHFGYQRPLFTTPRMTRGVTSFVVGLFSSWKESIGIGKKSKEGAIGQLEYTSGASASLKIPTSPSLAYHVDLVGQQVVAGLHIDSHRSPNVYRHVAQFPATAPSVRDIGNSLNSEMMHYYSSGGVSQGSLYHIKMTLIQMSIFGHGNSTMEPIPELVKLFSGFEEKLRQIFPKSLGFQKLIIRSPEVILSTRTGDFIVDSASGGIIKLFEITWQIYFFSQGKEGFAITIDEPENHLHPSMQKSLLPSILRAFPNVQMIVATHSPFIISAMRESNVYVLKYLETEIVDHEADDDQSIRGLSGARVVAEKLDTVNRAGTASEILREVLGITTTIPDWAENRIDEIIQSFRDKEMTPELLKSLFSILEKEGLASSYPSAIAELTREK